MKITSEIKDLVVDLKMLNPRVKLEALTNEGMPVFYAFLLYSGKVKIYGAVPVENLHLPEGYCIDENDIRNEDGTVLVHYYFDPSHFDAVSNC